MNAARTLKGFLTIEMALTAATGLICFFAVRMLDDVQADVADLKRAKEQQAVEVARVKAMEEAHYVEIIRRLEEMRELMRKQ